MNNNKICYAGIGSRNISDDEKNTIISLARLFSKLNIYGYSGHAEGADQAFEEGADPDKFVAWIPWKNFNKPYKCQHVYIKGKDPASAESIDKFHPCPSALSYGGRMLMSRNYFQVMGDQEQWPTVKFIVCCSNSLPNGDVTGGTGQAVRIAKSLNIPMFNIRTETWKFNLYKYLVDELKLKIEDTSLFDGVTKLWT